MTIDRERARRVLRTIGDLLLLALALASLYGLLWLLGEFAPVTQ